LITFRYPEYNFFFDEKNAKEAVPTKRYTSESFQGLLYDIYLLSACDYVVCTFSSQICRLVYELMQTKYPDASWRFQSLDDIYFVGDQQSHLVRFIFNLTISISY
jgi:glycoprotein 6-alpha-L-fucosyltransferase